MNQDQSESRRQLDFERTVFLYEGGGTGFLGFGLCAVFMGFVVRELLSPGIAAAWTVTVLVTYVPRVVLWRLFILRSRDGDITPESALSWERGALWASVVPYLVFALAAFLPYGEDVQTALLFFTLFVVLLVGGGALMYSTSPGPLLLFMNVNLVAIVARSLSEGGRLLTLLGFILTVAYLMLTRVILRGHKMMVESLALKIDHAHRSFVDPLTGLWNRRRLELFVSMLVPASRRSGSAFGIVLLDIDHFKRFNDTQGHQAGDELLGRVAGVLKECARAQDLVVRYGGEEFLLVLPGTNRDAALHVAERIRVEVRERTHATLSAGVDESSPERSFEQMLERADAALYEAKQAGRDQVRGA